MTKKDEKLRVLQQLIKRNGADFSDVTLLVVQHIKENTIEFIHLLQLSGFKKIVVIGKPYSVNLEALPGMQKYATVIVPSSEELESLQIIKKVVTETIAENNKFLCFDLGGYFGSYFYSLEEIPENLMGVIEDTKNGLHWIPKDKKLRFSLFSVASSLLKMYGENYFVAKAIARNSENILMNNFQETLASKKILILGYGSIGTYLAHLLKREAIVSVYDRDKRRMLAAKVTGCTVLPNLESLDDFDVIIGITGEYVLNEELLRLKDGVFLVNGSTRQKEFNFTPVMSEISGTQEHKDFKEYKLKDGKTIHVLANGYPVNFLDTESVPEYILDLLYSEIFLLAKTLVNGRATKQGFFKIEDAFPEIETEIAELWLES